MEGGLGERENSKEEDEVMSEVHLGCPPHFSGPFISHFTFSFPPNPHGVELMDTGNGEDDNNEPSSSEQLVGSDEDGDLILPRRTKHSSCSACVSIQHSVTSTIPSVGLQLNLELAQDADRLSLSGLVGILIARVAEVVYITDHGVEILENCASNVHLNSGLFRSDLSVKVRELDWQNPWPPSDFNSQKRYSWTSAEVAEVNRAQLLLAADVIYSDELTDAFFSILQKLMNQDSEKVLYLAFEKRYNFTMYDLDVVANGYSHFLSYLTHEKGFIGKRIGLSEIPQFMRDYERGNDVELWEIKYAPEKR